MKIISKKYIVNFGKKNYTFSTYYFKKSIKIREKVLVRRSSSLFSAQGGQVFFNL